jgi:hypothetical protein
MKAKKTIYDLQKEGEVKPKDRVLKAVSKGVSDAVYQINKAGGSLSFNGKTVSVMIPIGKKHVGFFIMPEEALK